VLTGTVNSRADKRRAEAVAESVTGVTNVENRLRVKQDGDYGTNRYIGTELSGTTDTPTTTSTTGTSTKRATSGS
jgi:BON domain